jgi:DNA-binding transcriptional ArsR family regulator
MANYSGDLSQTFHALADPTRRRVVERLTHSPATVTELAQPFDMALPTFLQHLKVLEEADLVRSEKVGRVRTVHIQGEPIAEARQWMNEQLEIWQRRLDQLDNYVLTLAQQESLPGKELPPHKEGTDEQDR